MVSGIDDEFCRSATWRIVKGRGHPWPHRLRQASTAWTVMACMVGLFVGGVTLAWGDQATSPSTIKAESSNLYVENCGVNVAYLALRYFDKPQPIQALATNLGTGDHFEEFISLADIRRCLAKQSLTVAGYKAADVPIMLNQLEPKAAIIAYHAPPSEDALGHFTFLVPLSGGGVIVADPPGQPKRHTFQDAVTVLEQTRATGEFLLISKAKPPTIAPQASEKSNSSNVAVTSTPKHDNIPSVKVKRTLSKEKLSKGLRDRLTDQTDTSMPTTATKVELALQLEETSEEVFRQIAEAGFQVRIQTESSNIVIGTVYWSQLSALVQLDAVQRLELAYRR